jgi:hypothetical protein
MMVRNREDIACLSLTLGENINWAYEKERKIEQPKYDQDHAWQWKNADIDFNYPMSVCGHVFRTSDMTRRLVNGGYDNAWNLESSLVSNRIERPYMISYKTSKAVEICCNRVSPVMNKNGGGDIAHMNKRFLEGERLVLKPIENNSVHYDMEHEYERMV